MDVQKTIEFILEQQAQTAVWQSEASAWQAKAERRFDAIGKLIQTGMKMLVKLEQRMDLLTAEVRELAKSHRATQESIRKLTDSLLKQRTNGRQRGR